MSSDGGRLAVLLWKPTARIVLVTLVQYAAHPCRKTGCNPIPITLGRSAPTFFSQVSVFSSSKGLANGLVPPERTAERGACLGC